MCPINMFKMLKLVLCVCFFIICEGKIKFRYDYVYEPETDGFMKLHRIPAVWNDARMRCKSEGAVLASPNNLPTYLGLKAFMKPRLPKNQGIFTGIHSKFSKGDFFSIDGVPLGKMPVDWMPTEPNNLNNNENCIWFHGNGSIADVNCNDINPYVCFKKRTSDMVLNRCGTVDQDYIFEPRTGSCYKFHKIARIWSRAFMTCAGEGAHLAIANSHEEGKVLKEIFAKNPATTILQVNNGLMRDLIHMGFHDWDERGDWTTIDGVSITDVGFNVWPNGQPDNATTGEFCGAMWRGGELDDVWCGEIGPFICEMKPNSLIEEDDGVMELFREKN